MDWHSTKTDLKWRLKHELFRRVLPRLEYEPFAIRNLLFKAWPKVANTTSHVDYSNGIDEREWRLDEHRDDGSELVSAYAAESKPLVLRGYASGCEVASWSLQDLASEFGEMRVTVRVGDYRTEFGQPRSITLPLREFVEFLDGQKDFPRAELLVEGVGPYVGNQQIPEIAERLPYPSWFESDNDRGGAQSNLTTFWLGSANAMTPLHCHHFCDTFVTQLIGRRRFTLIPPHEGLRVGYMPHNMNIGNAAYNPYDPDCDEFPGSGEIVRVDIDLDPGDVLLLPGFWFHAVTLSAPSLSASRFVRSKMPAVLGGGPVKPWREVGGFVRGW